MQSQIKALIFDMDNTLLDFYKFKRASSLAAVKTMIKHGLKAKQADAERVLWSLYYEMGFESRGVFQELMKRLGHDSKDLKMLASAIVAYREARAHSLVAYSEVFPTLKTLKKRGYRLWIVSDAPGLKAWIRLASVGLDDMFERVITKDDTGSFKASGIPFKYAIAELAEFNITSGQVLVIGDSGSRDIIPAQTAGMKTATAVYGRQKPSRVKADYELKSIKDLLKICK